MNVGIALMVTTLSGLCTAIGGMLVLCLPINNRLLSASMAFSAGVMIYVSLADILVSSQSQLYIAMGNCGRWIAIVCFVLGMTTMYLIDRLLPEDNNMGIDDISTTTNAHLQRTGTTVAIAIAVHNFPEGIATFVAIVANSTMGLPIVIAIALHNIPEGIAISSPIYYATKDKAKAFCHSLWAGLAEPMGAVVAWLILMPIVSAVTTSVALCIVAGIMVYIAVEELLPQARQYNSGWCIVSFGLGMTCMAISLILLD